MTSAGDLTHRYAAYLHTQLLGDDTESVDFGLWLDEHWSEGSPDGDDFCLDETTGQAVSGCAMTWVEREGEIVGFLAGRARGCYRVPRDSEPPAIALYLDDAPGCSTGSAIQERAFALAHGRVAATPILISILSLEDEPLARAPLGIAPAPPLLEIVAETALGGGSM